MTTLTHMTGSTTATFNQQPWNERKAFLGTTSEAAFEDYARNEGIRFERLGMDRESPLNYRSLHPYLSLRPDYICQQEKPFFCEVKSVGRDAVIKLKTISLEVLRMYATWHPVNIFVWDSVRRQCTMPGLAEIMKAIRDLRLTTALFDDGNPYYGVPAERFKWQALTGERVATA